MDTACYHLLSAWGYNKDTTDLVVIPQCTPTNSLWSSPSGSSYCFCFVLHTQQRPQLHD